MSDPPQAEGQYRAIVIGSGMAGLFAALEASSLGPVLLATKAELHEGNTRHAQGGIAAAIGPGDSPEQHLADTIAAGAGLVDEENARILVESASRRISDLERYGVHFDSEGVGPAFGREGAHGQARVLHALGDRTGAAIETALAQQVENGRVVVYEHTLAVEIVLAKGQAVGIRAINQQAGTEYFFEASAIVLATGGAGAAFSHTTNTPVATGDGIALAFAAGAEVTDLEFYQFHPTAFRQQGAPPFLISEALRGEGAVLRNHQGQAFMAQYHELADLAPRDIVARAILSEMRASNSDHIWLDCTVLNNLNPIERFPGIAGFCGERGIDLRNDQIPVAPAAHYLMGGVRTDNWGRTTVPGLYACGESAATGVHGANRLASNSLLETVVFAKRAVEHIESNTGGALTPSPDSIPFVPAGGTPGETSTIQRLLWKHAGIERTGEELRAGLAAVRAWPMKPGVASRENHELVWLSIFAELLLSAALIREESRGAHFRTDFPERNDQRWGRHLVFHHAD